MIAALAIDTSPRVHGGGLRDSIPRKTEWLQRACTSCCTGPGGEKRLKRQTLMESKTFATKDEAYSREELRAELGSMILAAEHGIPHDPRQHAAYVACWIKALRKDKNEICRAAADV